MRIRSIVLSGILYGALAGMYPALADEAVGTSQADLPSWAGAFAIYNNTNVTINYSYRWGNHAWKKISLASGRFERHSYPLDGNGRAPAPEISFDNVGGDGRVTSKTYSLDFAKVGSGGFGPAGGFSGKPKEYYFKYAADGRHLDLKAR